MARVLVVGGGTGGIVAANELRRLLPRRHKVTLIEKGSDYAIGATKPWVMLGVRTPQQVSRPVDRLKRRHVEVLRSVVQRIDPAKVSVATDRGEVKGDFMVIALGADYDMAAIPGLDRAAQTFYTMDGAVRLRDTLKSFTGGDVVVLIPRGPFKCPPAPYEGAMLLHDYFRKRGVLGKTHISVITVEGAPMATAGPEIGRKVRGLLEERGIGFQTLKRTKNVDSDRRLVIFEDGSEAKYDLLIAIPPHVAPSAVRESGLTNQSGWIPAEPTTLKMAGGSGRVYVIGDVSVVPLPGRFRPDAPLVLPKAGAFAEGHARSAAAHIAAEINGSTSDAAFDGKGFCYMETGDRHALRGDGSFFDLPNPTMQSAAPDMMQYEGKIRWIEDWMRRNLE